MRHKETITPIIIAGPTGSGKTAVAAALARRIGGEIISADSRQVYRYLDIGTNKAGVWSSSRNARIFNGIAQHLTDCIEPSDHYSAGVFARESLSLIARMKENGITPIITGGTGLYIKALVDGLSAMPEKDPVLRQELQERLAREGADSLYTELKDKDPVAADKNRRNPQRLLRALEVFLLTGTPLSVLQQTTNPPTETFLQFGLFRQREALYRNLNRRSEEMLSAGMIEETRRVLAMDFPPSAPGLQSLGYREIVDYLAGKLRKTDVLELLQRATRHYAKRQMTWFKKDPRIRWVPTMDNGVSPEEAAGSIAKIIGI